MDRFRAFADWNTIKNSLPIQASLDLLDSVVDSPPATTAVTSPPTTSRPSTAGLRTTPSVTTSNTSSNNSTPTNSRPSNSARPSGPAPQPPSSRKQSSTSFGDNHQHTNSSPNASGKVLSPTAKPSVPASVVVSGSGGSSNTANSSGPTNKSVPICGDAKLVTTTTNSSTSPTPPQALPPIKVPSVTMVTADALAGVPISPYAKHAQTVIEFDEQQSAKLSPAAAALVLNSTSGGPGSGPGCKTVSNQDTDKLHLSDINSSDKQTTKPTKSSSKFADLKRVLFKKTRSEQETVQSIDSLYITPVDGTANGRTGRGFGSHFSRSRHPWLTNEIALIIMVTAAFLALLLFGVIIWILIGKKIDFK